jgi:hypothetical protein
LTLPLWIAFAAWAVEAVVIAALSATRRGAQASVALAIAMLTMAGFVDTDNRFALCVLGILLLFCLFRAWDFATGPALPGFWHRLLHLVAIIDTRRVVRIEPRFDPRILLRLALAAAVSVFAWWVVVQADGFTGWPRYALRWYVGGFLLPFAVFEVVDALLVLATVPFGWSAPPINRTPYLSRSVAEFWSKRWNSIIGTILREHVYRPYSRRGAMVGVVAAFVFSAAFHAYLIGVALDSRHALAWVAFFLAQPALLVIERKLGVRRWKPVWGWAWTLGSLAVLFPLFIEPVLVLFAQFLPAGLRV